MPRRPRLRHHHRTLARPCGAAAAADVRAAVDADLAYVVDVQKRHGDALGFLPRAALAEKIALGRVHLALENGAPAGFLHHGSLAAREVRVFQAAIQYDARRRHLGLALVDDLLGRAAAAGARGVSLRCLTDLDANHFWRAAGFRLLDTEPGARGPLNVWGRVLRPGVGAVDPLRVEGRTAAEEQVPVTGPAPAGEPFRFHSRLHPCPRCGRWTTDTWARGARRFTLCQACLATSGMAG